MKKSDFIDFLELTIKAVKEDDSFEGRINYEIGQEQDTYNVNAFVRVGNSMGQGGSMFVQDKLSNDDDSGPDKESLMYGFEIWAKAEGMDVAAATDGVSEVHTLENATYELELTERAWRAWTKKSSEFFSKD